MSTGTVQGNSISPLLANVYLHYVFDLWVQERRTQWAYGDVIVVRFADDAVLGFQHRGVAQQFLEDLRQRLAEFGLELHPDKTRLLEFGPYAAQEPKRGWVGQTGDIQLSRLHAYLREEEKQWHVYGVAPDHAHEVASQTEGREARPFGNACTTLSRK